MFENPHEPITQSELLEELRESWLRVERTVHDVQQRGHSDLRDAAEWTPLDHLAHLAMWAQSMLVMVRSGRPQWEGLSVPREMLESSLATGEYDAINEAIRKQTANWSLERVEEHLRDVHSELLQAVEGLSDKELLQPGFAYAEGGGDAPMIVKLRGNTSLHYLEHCEYIDRLLEQA